MADPACAGFVWKSTVSRAATRPWLRSFSPARMSYWVIAPIITSKSATGVPNDRVTAIPFRCGSTVSTTLAGTPRNSSNKRSSATVPPPLACIIDMSRTLRN